MVQKTFTDLFLDAASKAFHKDADNLPLPGGPPPADAPSKESPSGGQLLYWSRAVTKVFSYMGGEVGAKANSLSQGVDSGATILKMFQEGVSTEKVAKLIETRTNPYFREKLSEYLPGFVAQYTADLIDQMTDPLYNNLGKQLMDPKSTIRNLSLRDAQNLLKDGNLDTHAIMETVTALFTPNTAPAPTPSSNKSTNTPAAGPVSAIL